MGQIRIEEKSNEITAIPALLSKLDIRGGIVSIDATGCQKAIAAQNVHLYAPCKHAILPL